MSESVESQIARFVGRLDVDHPAITSSELETQHGDVLHRERRSSARGVLLLTAAVVVPVVLVSVALVAFRPTSNQVPVPVVTTPASPPVTTTASTSVPAEELFNEAGPLTFSPTSAPSDEWPVGGSWVSDRFIVAFGTDLYWTTDGTNWHLDEDFAALQAQDLPPGTAATIATSSDGERLVVAMTPPRPTGSDATFAGFGSYTCVEPGDELSVYVRESSGVWSSSRVAIPIITNREPFSCVPVTGVQVTVGPRGMILVIQGYGLFGYDDDQERYPDMPEPSRRGIAFFSPDGVEWTDIGPIPPFVMTVDGGPVAGTNAFYATVEFEVEASGETVRLEEITYRSDDGLDWVPDPELREFNRRADFAWWDGQLVQNIPGGVLMYEMPQQTILTDAPAVGRLFIGEQWIFGGAIGGHPFGHILTGRRVFFSPDGITATTWTPTELLEVGLALHVVGVADDFVVLHDPRQPGESTLWIGRLTDPD